MRMRDKFGSFYTDPRQHTPADGFDRYGRHFEDYRLPPGRPERYALAETMRADGVQLLVALYAAEAPS
jgi:transposase